MNKELCKIIAQRNNVQTAQWIRCGRDTFPQRAPFLPAVIKPIDCGSSVGISIAHSQKEYRKAIEKSLAHSHEILIEQFIQGKEYTVAIVDTKYAKACPLPVIYIKPPSEFFDFENKYNGATEEICPAPLTEEIAKKLQECAQIMHMALGVRHLSRSDFILNTSNQPVFLEINTIPGLTRESLMPKALEAGGVVFKEVLASWIEESS